MEAQRERIVCQACGWEATCWPWEGALLAERHVAAVHEPGETEQEWMVKLSPGAPPKEEG